MKQFFRNGQIILMLVLALAAGGGFTITRMICTGSGNTSYELGQMKKCNGDKHGNGTCIGQNCCLMNASELSAGEHTASVKPEASNQPLQVIGIPFLTPVTAGNNDNDKEDDPSAFDPPDLGVIILRLISILLI